MADELTPQFELRKFIDERTPARLFVDRAGPAYRTATQLALRRDHALAVDAVREGLNWRVAWGDSFVERFRLFEVQTQAHSKQEYLLKPERGRQFDSSARALLIAEVTKGCRLQIVIGDGLSAVAVAKQVPLLLPRLVELALARGWTIGRPFVVRHCRVGIMNQIGELLRPELVVLLIGERPGLATSESMSAYMGYRSNAMHTDAQRNLISNIHERGLPADEAPERILRLAAELLVAQKSGVHVKENPRLS